jgi:hypothetical protein
MVSQKQKKAHSSYPSIWANPLTVAPRKRHPNDKDTVYWTVARLYELCGHPMCKGQPVDHRSRAAWAINASGLQPIAA